MSIVQCNVIYNVICRGRNLSTTSNFTSSDRARNAFEEPQRLLAELSRTVVRIRQRQLRRHRKTHADNGTRLECTQMQGERSSRIVTKAGTRQSESVVQIT